MTISTTTSRQSYNGNGVTTIFSVPFRFFASTDLVVELVTVSTGASTPLTLTTHYTVTGADDESGGSLTMLTAPAVGQRLVIRRVITATQEVDYVAGDPFPAETHERALDRLTMLAQQGEEVNARALVFPSGDTASGEIPAVAARANKLLGFDSSGELKVTAPASGSAAELALDLSSPASGKGPDLVGADVAEDYADGSLGFLVVKNTGSGYNALRGFSKAEQELIQSGASTADHAAVLDAMLSTERHLFIPRGTYRRSTGFNLSSYDHLEGAGIGLTNILMTADDTAVDVLGSFCKVEGFTLKKTGAHTKSGVVNGSAAVKADRNLFRDIISEGFGSHGVEMVNGNICHFYNVHGQLNTGWGLYFARTVGIVDNHGHHIDASCNWNGNTGGGVSLTTGTATADATAPKAISGRLNTQNNTGPGIYIGTTRNDFIVYSEANFGGDVTKQCILDTYAIGNKIHSLEGAVYGNVAGVAGSLDGNIVTMSNGFADYRAQTKGKHTFAGGAGKGLRIYLDDATSGYFDIEKTGTREIRYKFAGSTGAWNAYHEHTTPGTEAAQWFGGRLIPITTNIWDLGSSSFRWKDVYLDRLVVGAGNRTITFGSGSPEGVVVASPGAIYSNTSGGAGTTLYVKESGSGTNTGWVAK